jgi:hypothetical protein
METVVETEIYLKAAAAAGMTDAEREAAVNLLSANPLAGDLIVGAGGCRKVRLAGKGRGKSGGYRLITIIVLDGRVFILTVFAKGQRVSLSHAEKNQLHAIAKRLNR